MIEFWAGALALTLMLYVLLDGIFLSLALSPILNIDKG